MCVKLRGCATGRNLRDDKSIDVNEISKEDVFVTIANLLQCYFIFILLSNSYLIRHLITMVISTINPHRKVLIL